MVMKRYQQKFYSFWPSANTQKIYELQKICSWNYFGSEKTFIEIYSQNYDKSFMAHTHSLSQRGRRAP